MFKSITAAANSVNQVKANEPCSKDVKFEVLIGEIGEKLSKQHVGIFGAMLLAVHQRNPLFLIYEYGNANAYRQAILKEAKIELPEWFKYTENDMGDIKIKMRAMREFIEEFRKEENREESWKFIFWSLFAMAVDKSDYDEKAAVVADFACMLKIDENTLQDIISVIKVVCGEENSNVEFKTDEIRNAFANVVLLF